LFRYTYWYYYTYNILDISFTIYNNLSGIRVFYIVMCIGMIILVCAYLNCGSGYLISICRGINDSIEFAFYNAGKCDCTVEKCVFTKTFDPRRYWFRVVLGQFMLVILTLKPIFLLNKFCTLGCASIVKLV